MKSEKMDWKMTTYDFPERLWRRPIHFHNGKMRIHAAASTYTPPTTPPILRDDDTTDPQGERLSEPKEDRLETDQENEPQVRISTEAGNAKITVDLTSVGREDLKLNCAEDAVTLSLRTSRGSWVKEIRLPFRADPDTAKATFRNGRLELVVRKHGRFNPPGPRIDWV